MHQIENKELFGTRVGPLVIGLYRLHDPQSDATAYPVRITHSDHGEMMSCTFPTYSEGIDYVVAWLDSKSPNGFTHDDLDELVATYYAKETA